MESIEFFFSKEKKYQIPFALNLPKKKEKVHSYVSPKKILKTTSIPVKRVTPKEKTLELPTKKKAIPKKDAFYSEWEKKYKELQAENLLAKKPFKRHALFIVDGEKEFAEKIAGAIHSRLMKTTFLFSKKPLSELVENHAPTHIITARDEKETLDLPTITIENLVEIKKDASKKKVLWSTLQQSLKEA